MSAFLRDTKEMTTLELTSAEWTPALTSPCAGGAASKSISTLNRKVRRSQIATKTSCPPLRAPDSTLLTRDRLASLY